MSWRSKYNIEFKGLNEGIHDYDYQIDNLFFEHFEERLVNNGQVKVKVSLEKRSSFLKIHLKIKGWLEMTCDRCLDNYHQEIKNKAELFVKFGEKEFEDGDNVIWIQPQEYVINVSQILYEYVTLSIPLRQIHPKDKNGKRACSKEMIRKLKDYSHAGKEEEEKTDPRWDALKNLGKN